MAKRRYIEMKKIFWQSKTFWGAILLGVETTLIALQVQYPWMHAVAGGLGAFLTLYGFRSAMPKK
jgi:hypothetical protein